MAYVVQYAYVPHGLDGLNIGATWIRWFNLGPTWPSPRHIQGVTWSKSRPIIGAMRHDLGLGAMWPMWCRHRYHMAQVFTLISTKWFSPNLSLVAMCTRFSFRLNLQPSLGFTQATQAQVNVNGLNLGLTQMPHGVAQVQA